MMNDKIVIQNVTESRSATGGVTQTPATYLTLWAEVEQASGNENFTSDMNVYNDIKRFTVYYQKGKSITPKMRVVYRTDTYHIISLSNEDRLKTVITAVRYDDE
jgi:SPP1 family predicted phage head-tail adaptor